MVGPAILISLVVVLGFSYVIFDALTFLRPYKALIRAHYLPHVTAYFTILSVNVFAGSLLLVRKLGLRTTGAKLKHLEKEGLAGTALAAEIVNEDQE
jgi:hypothetical protein